jgi:hypothetical protein
MICVELASADFITAGRAVPEERDKRLTVTVGTVKNMDALVEETTRKLYDVTGSYWKQDDAESYDLNDFGIGDTHAAVGFEFENNGTFWTFMWDAEFFSMSTETTARRNYYIGVGDGIEFGGSKYTNMRIPEGTDFSIDLIGCQSDLRGLFTPFTLAPTEMVRFSPWLSISLMLFLGQYDIDAGPATGTYVYMNPPETFVQGGSSGGLVGLGLPEVGGGGELRLGVIDGAELVLQGNYSVCNVKGSTKFLTSSRHRSKDATIEHENIFGRAMLELPFGEGRAFSLGAQYQQIDSEALITSQSTDPDEIVANQERFDKYVRFHMETTMILLGVTF